MEFTDTQGHSICPFCGKVVDPNNFKDDLSKQEFQISSICQRCQDNFFGTEEKDD